MIQAAWWRAALSVALILTSGCGLLDVSDDPNVVEEADLANPTGAEMMRRGALSRFYDALSENTYRAGVLADEFVAVVRQSSIQAGTAGEFYHLDTRHSVNAEQGGGFAYRDLQEARQQASTALGVVRAYASPEVRGPYAAQLLATRGMIKVLLAEDYCPGVPLHDVVDGRVVLSGPLATADILTRAIVDFDSALAEVGDSIRMADMARVGKARALLNLGEFAEAGAMAADVQSGFVWNAEFGGNGANNSKLRFVATQSSVADTEGGNGLPYVSAADPRLVTYSLGPAEDGTPLYGIGKYSTTDQPIVIASKLEARLIEAEAALNADDASWLTILNELRANEVDPALAPLDDPGSFAARVDLLYRERAFWLYATDHRLGDLRRLVRVYGRDPEQLYPVGTYWLGGVYDAATALPIPVALEPGFTCTSR